MDTDPTLQSAFITSADGVGINKFEEYLSKPYFYTYADRTSHQTARPLADPQEANIDLVLPLDDGFRQREQDRRLQVTTVG